MTAGSIAGGEIAAARAYTCGLLETFDEAEWFRQPTEGVTHVAWQVGHLAMAEFFLVFRRLRGEQPGDDDLMPASLVKLFGRGSVPDADSSKYPAPAEIRAVFDKVHERAVAEIAKYTDVELQQPALGAPHTQFPTKQGALFWCARHEMLHAGQIGLLKRLLGRPPQW